MPNSVDAARLRRVLAQMGWAADAHALTDEEIAALLRALDFVDHVDDAHPPRSEDSAAP